MQVGATLIGREGLGSFAAWHESNCNLHAPPVNLGNATTPKDTLQL